ncbi:MAG: MFS transporter [Candidatus Hodarchaeales archaeon]
MSSETTKQISPRVSLISAVIVHACVEIPFFIFPVILVLVGTDLFDNLTAISWLGLGSLGTVGTLSAALPSPLFGALADKYRRGLMMLISLLLAIFGSLLIGLWGNQYIVMLLGIIFIGLAISLYHPPGLSWVSSAYEDPETRGYSRKYNQILAIHGVGGGIGAAIGPLSVYFLLDKISWQQIYLFWIAPLFLIAFFFWFLVARYEVENVPKGIKSHDGTESKNSLVLRNKFSINVSLILIFAFMMVMSLNRGMVNFILSPFLSEVKQIQVTDAALFIGLSSLLGSTGQLFGGVLGDRFGEDRILAFCSLAMVVILSLIYIADSFYLLFLTYLSLGIINSTFWPSTNSLVAKNSQKPGQAFGMVMLLANLLGALGPIIDGLLLGIDQTSYLLIFIFAGGFSALAFLFLLIYRRIR